MNRITFYIVLIVSSLLGVESSKTSLIWGETQIAKPVEKGFLNSSLQFKSASMGEYVKDIRGVNGEVYNDVVSPEFTVTEWNLGFNYGVTEVIDLSVSLPLYQQWLRTSQLSHPELEQGFLWPGTKETFGVGDLNVGVSVSVPLEFSTPLQSLIYSGSLSFPTGSEEDAYFPARLHYYRNGGTVQGFYTSGMMELENRVTALFDFSLINSQVPLYSALSVGVRLPMYLDTVSGAFLVSAELGYRPLSWLSLSGVVKAEPQFKSFSNGTVNQNHYSVSPSITFNRNDEISFSLGSQFGLNPNASIVYGNSSAFTEEASIVELETAPIPPVTLTGTMNWLLGIAGDRDGDRVLNRRDNCPDRQEDADGYLDSDGCPDPDNDGDGILDRRDKCPMVAEIVNGYLDRDGCPDCNLSDSLFLDSTFAPLVIGFEENEKELTEDSKQILRAFVSEMIVHPSYRVEFVLATTKPVLGEQRLNKLLDFCILEGVESSRLIGTLETANTESVTIIRRDLYPKEKPMEEKVEKKEKLLKGVYESDEDW